MSLKTIYYRGPISSCNYQCSYCPFRRRRSGLAADRAALNRFCDKVPSLGSGLTVMFVPHGEVMIHEYYQRAMADLCHNKNVGAVGCQTNLSFDIEKFADRIGGGASKISLWCTFHPSQVRLGDFLKQCEKLTGHGISFCVGSVGRPSDIPVLQRLRDNLPEDIYMWVNAQDGLSRDYSDEEVIAFSRIDPLFGLELGLPDADPGLCGAGCESIFVRGNGDYFACNISKVRLGNLYSGAEPKPEKLCLAKKCGCYLAYSNRAEMHGYFLSGRTIPARNPSAKKAMFFDVDGTLTDASGSIPKENIEAVRRLAEKQLIFLATSLPFEYANSTCRDIWDCIAGGVFAEGSDIRIFDSGFKKIIPLSEAAIDMLPSGAEYVCYREDGILHKITAVSGYLPDTNNFNIVRAEVTGVVSKDADKLNGVRCICSELGLLSPNITVVGNSENDAPMLGCFKNSVAVLDADEAAKRAARFICGIPNCGQLQFAAERFPSPGSASE